MANGTDSSVLTITGLVTDSEGVVRTVVGTATISKSRKAAPVLKIEITNKSQSVTAKSTGVQIGGFSNPVVTVSETYNGATTTKTITALTATSGDIATIVTTAGTGTITLSGRTLANGTDSTIVSVSATITDSEATSRSVTDTVSLSKIKNAPPTTLVSFSADSQNVASSSAGYAAPSNFSITVKETTSYSYSTGLGASTYYVSAITGGTNNANGTITPSTPTTDAGVTVSVTISYVNSEGVAGSEVRTHKVSVSKEGRQGPGLLFIGDYATKKAADPGFVLNNNATKKDAVKHSGKFYAFRGADLTTIGATSTPTNGGDASWEEFTSFSAISTGLLIAEESYVENTINVGTNAAGNAANITIWGGDGSPYISIGQGGTKGYAAAGKGIFLGTDASTSKISIKNTAGSKYILWDGENLSIAAGNFSLDTSGNINASSVTLSGALTATTLTANQAGTIGGWTISSNTLTGGQTLLQSDGVIKLRDANGVTKVSLNYDTTNATDPLNATAGVIPLTGTSAGTAHFETGSLSNQGANGYLQVPGPTYPTWPYAPTWNLTTNFTVPLTATYEFSLKIPTTIALSVTALPDTAPESFPGPYVALRLYIYGPGSTNMYSEEYVSGLVESAHGGAYGTEGYPTSTVNAFYMNSVNLVAGVTYSFLLQYIVFNVDYNNVLDINYYLPNINVNYFAAVASSNMNQSGINLGQDTDRYVFTKPGLLDLWLSSDALVNGVPNGVAGNDSAQNRQTIGEIAGPFILYNSDSKGHLSNNQRIYINNAASPRSNRSAGGNFLTSYFYGGFNRSFQLLRAYGLFEPDSSTNHTIYSTIWWAYSYNIETVTYVTTNTFAVTFVEPLYSNESWSTQGIVNPLLTSKQSFYTVGLISNNSGLTLVNVTNQTYNGFTMVLSGEKSAGELVSVIVYK